MDGLDGSLVTDERGFDQGDRLGRARRVVTSAARFVRDPVAGVLVIAGVVELLSGGTAARGAALFVGAGLVVADRVPWIRARLRPGRAGRQGSGGQRLELVVERRSVTIGAVVAAAGLATFERASWPATITVAAVGLVAVGWAWRTVDAGRAEQPPTGWQVWCVVALLLGLWELGALLAQPSLAVGSYDHPTISTLTDPILATVPGRVIGLVAWLAAGRALVRRA